MTQGTALQAITKGLVHETFVSSLSGNSVEWGFCFKRPGCDDTEFELVIGNARHEEGIAARIEGDLARLEWAAKAVSEASMRLAEGE